MNIGRPPTPAPEVPDQVQAQVLDGVLDLIRHAGQCSVRDEDLLLASRLITIEELLRRAGAAAGSGLVIEHLSAREAIEIADDVVGDLDPTEHPPILMLAAAQLRTLRNRLVEGR